MLTLNVGECTKKLYYSFIAFKNVKWCGHFEKKSLAVTFNMKNKVVTRLGHVSQRLGHVS